MLHALTSGAASKELDVKTSVFMKKSMKKLAIKIKKDITVKEMNFTENVSIDKLGLMKTYSRKVN